MNWYKQAKKKYPDFLNEWAIRVFGVDLNEGKVLDFPKKKKEKKEDCDCSHSMDPHCDGGDDGW